MSNGDWFRTSHIKRIYQNDDPESDVWIDIERIDELWRATEHGSDGQESHWIFDWNSFDPSQAPTKRITDSQDNTNGIDVPVRAGYFMRSSIDGQAAQYEFINDATNQARLTHSRRIYHHEIKVAYVDGDGNPPRDPEDYLNSLGDQDQSQYVDVEVIDANWSGQKRLRDLHGQRIKTFVGLLKAINAYKQRKKWLSSDQDRLLREPLLDSDVTDSNFVPIVNPDAGPQIDPPWRLDPIQIVVNVQWNTGLAVIFGPQATDAPKQDKPKT
jgi:hypothetical protein